jgi:sugar phosphate isomerase/epimerase
MFKNLNPSALGVSGHQSEIIELALTYGFRGLDINIEEFSARVKLHGVKYARRLIDSAKIRVGSFQLPLNWDIDDEAFKKELQKLAEHAAVATDMGCTRCLCTVAPASDKRPYHENFEFHRRRFAEICRVLEPAGVTLGAAFCAPEGLRKGQAFQFVHDFDALSLLLNMVGVPNLGMLVDVWDLYVSGGGVENVRSLPVQQIVAVRLADVPPETRPAELTEQARLLPGVAGQIDCVGYLTTLAEMGYNGPVSVRPDRRAFESSRRDRIVKQAGDALDKVWKAAGLTSDGKLSVAASR